MKKLSSICEITQIKESNLRNQLLQIYEQYLSNPQLTLTYKALIDILSI